MISTTFEFLAAFVMLTLLLHLVFVLKVRTKRLWFVAEWLSLITIAVGSLIAVGELRSITQRRRFQDLDAFMQSRASNARGRAEDMISYCRKLVEMSGGATSPSSKEWQVALVWAEAAASDLRSRYETNNWQRFLQKHSNVSPTEDPVVQQLKLPILSLLMEMQAGNRNLNDYAQELKRRGQLLWLAPISPWLLVIGFALRFSQLTASSWTAWKTPQ